MKKAKNLAALYLTALALFTAFTALDAFVIPRAYGSAAVTAAPAASPAASACAEPPAQSAAPVSDAGPTADAASAAAAEPVSKDKAIPSASETPAAETAQSAAPETVTRTDTVYADENIRVELTQYRAYDSDIFAAEVWLSDASALQTALAQSVYGKNVKQKTSEIAAQAGAILAVNGDFYGSQNDGYVLRNGVLYREVSAGAAQQDLVIWPDGTLEVVTEGNVNARSLLDAGARQVLCFGPGLVLDGQIAVSQNAEVAKARESNPRTAVCQLDALHYLFVVADGRTDESAGLTLYELAEFLQGLGVQTAYNLDGGGSSTMVFQGQVVNSPVSGKRSSSERSVSDIVCICP